MPPPYLQVQDPWVDSVLNSLSLEQKIGQLFMVACWSRDLTQEIGRVSELINRFEVGGIIFMQGSPLKQAVLTNYFQGISRVPLLISMDAEWGLGMRLDSVPSFQKQLVLGAVSDTAILYEMGSEIARQLKRLGVHMSFSPVVDINNNPLNPVIADRSFGENKFEVSRRGLTYMNALQDNRIIACAKHFPGHGNTEHDSHELLPVITAGRSELENMELFPFRNLINAGVGSVMVAHLNIPSLDSTPHLPSTLSPRIVTGLLRHELGFQGLVVTDAMNMKSITNSYEPGAANAAALLAGNDILLFADELEASVSLIKEAIVRHEITETDINIRVRKILQAKFWCGLSETPFVPLQTLHEDLNNLSSKLIKRRIAESSITLASNKDNLIPFRRLDTLRFASVAIGDTVTTEFQHMLHNYAQVVHFALSKTSAERDFNALLDSLKGFNAVLVSIHDMSRLPAYNYGVTQASIRFVQGLKKRVPVILTLFGSPYALSDFEGVDWVAVAYNNDPVTQQMAAEVLFGGMAASGKLPVTASPEFRAGQGAASNSIRMKHVLPEQLGISSGKLREIDRIAEEAIQSGAMPGCQILIAKDEQVIWNKSYGHFTYDLDKQVENHDLFDLASITKIAATTLMVMKLYEEEKIDIKKYVEDYLPEFKGTDKGKLMLADLLTHQAGLKPYIPFYRETLDSAGNPRASIYRTKPGETFTLEVARELYMNRHYVDTMWWRIANSPLETKGKYVYSDLGFYFLQRVAERVSGVSLDQYVYDHFYRPLGLATMCFNPTRFFEPEHLVPSNFDYSFRKKLIQGTVHDQGAAMLGGVAGHAGLFSNAHDLAVLMQMLLNHGSYAGTRYLDSGTVALFTSKYFPQNRRGLGFDKPETAPGKPSPAARSVSPRAFGHQGFTGTCVWADPEYRLIYVFLSNRTFPDDSNSRLNEMSVRTRIQDVIYESILQTDQ